MIGHIPRNTRIFIGLSIVTLLLTYLAITLSDIQGNYFLSKGRHHPYKKRIEATKKPIDTAMWETYEDPQLPLSFRLPEEWTVTTSNLENNFYDIALANPGQNGQIHIYVSKDGYLGLQGLNEKPFELAGAKGTKINDSLFGLKAGEYYFTFDGSMAPSIQEEYAALLTTLKFE